MLFRKSKKRKNQLHREFYESIKDIYRHSEVQRMRNYNHHGNTDCLQHCINVAFMNFQICKFFDFNAEQAARGAMLHDLFLYDWHTHAAETGDRVHAITHPTTALNNAQKHFNLTKIEKDVIINHMWPVTFYRRPRTWEGFITTISDKICGLFEVIKYHVEKK